MFHNTSLSSVICHILSGLSFSEQNINSLTFTPHIHQYVTKNLCYNIFLAFFCSSLQSFLMLRLLFCCQETP